MSQNIHETKSPAKRKLPPSGSDSHPEDQEHLAASQLWNAIEFSRQFPELTLYLVAELKITEQISDKRIQISAPTEPLEFPPLIASDPRELRVQTKKLQEEDDVEKEITLFAAGKLPPPELEPPVLPKKGKTQIWRYLLTFFALVVLLIWMYDGRHTQEVRHLQLQVSK